MIKRKSRQTRPPSVVKVPRRSLQSHIKDGTLAPIWRQLELRPIRWIQQTRSLGGGERIRDAHGGCRYAPWRRIRNIVQGVKMDDFAEAPGDVMSLSINRRESVYDRERVGTNLEID